MNLTNKTSNRYPCSASSFSKYLEEQDNLDDYNYSNSNINETLLLEATLLDSKKDQPQPQPCLPILDRLTQNSPSISQQKSLVFDLCGQFSISSSQGGSCQTDSKGQPTKQIQDLYNICGTLVETLSKLQTKVDKIEEKEVKVKDISRDQSRNSFEKEVQSRLTYSSLQNSKGCKCDNTSQKQIISQLFDILHSKSKNNSITQENQSLKKQVIRLQVANQELRKRSKRIEAQNHRLRQLLKQCQSFNKKLACQKESETRQKMSRKYSQKLFSQRQGNSMKNDPYFEEYSTFKSRSFYPLDDHFTSQKENIKLDSQLKFRQTVFETPTSEVHSCTHSPHPKKMVAAKGSFEPQIIFDPHQKVSPQSNIKIVSFEQCKGMDVPYSSPFVRKGGGVLKPLAQNHSKSFRDLRVVKSRNN